MESLSTQEVELITFNQMKIKIETEEERMKKKFLKVLELFSSSYH